MSPASVSAATPVRVTVAPWLTVVGLADAEAVGAALLAGVVKSSLGHIAVAGLDQVAAVCATRHLRMRCCYY